MIHMATRRRTKPMSDPYVDGVSYSSLCTFLVDRERYRIKAVEGLSPGGDSEALEFGNIFHHMLEMYAKGLTNLRSIETRILKKWGKTEESFELAKIAIRVLQHYLTAWDHADMDYVEQEEKFFIPIQISNGLTIPIRGRRDAVYRSIASGRLILQENKTKSRINHEYLNAILPFDMQTMMYCLSIKYDYQEEPKGVLYNVIRKPGLRRKVKETLNDFLKRIDVDIQDRPEHYYVRYNVEFGPKDIDNFFYKMLLPILDQVSVWWESIKHDPFNPWTLPNGSRNPHHFLRPFGVYDSLTQGKGDFFD